MYVNLLIRNQFKFWNLYWILVYCSDFQFASTYLGFLVKYPERDITANLVSHIALSDLSSIWYLEIWQEVGSIEQQEEKLVDIWF